MLGSTPRQLTAVLKGLITNVNELLGQEVSGMDYITSAGAGVAFLLVLTADKWSLQSL